MVDSPLYACQFVLVVNDTAVLKASAGGTGPKPCGLNGSTVLQPLHRVEHQHRDDAEQQQRDGVLGPAHLARLVDAGEPVDQPLERPQHRVEPGALAGEHAGHVAADERRHQEDGEQEERESAASR